MVEWTHLGWYVRTEPFGTGWFTAAGLRVDGLRYIIVPYSAPTEIYIRPNNYSGADLQAPVAGPFPTLEAAQAAYLLLID